MDTSFLSFSPTLQAIITTGRAKTMDGDTIEANSTSTLNNLHVLRSLIQARKPTETLEVGLAFGASALAILGTLREVHGGAPYHHTAIDPFQTGFWRGAGLAGIRDDGHTTAFSLLEKSSMIALPSLLEKGTRFDLIYIDGSHLFEDAFVDFYVSAFLLKMGGCVLFDDCRDPHVAKVIRFIRSNYSSILRPLPVEQHELQHKPLKKRIGNALGVRQLHAFEKIADTPRAWDSKFGSF